jgi:hypothetical protein
LYPNGIIIQFINGCSMSTILLTRAEQAREMSPGARSQKKLFRDTA